MSTPFSKALACGRRCVNPLLEAVIDQATAGARV
jgi:hypothetical protein